MDGWTAVLQLYLVVEVTDVQLSLLTVGGTSAAAAADLLASLCCRCEALRCGRSAASRTLASFNGHPSEGCLEEVGGAAAPPLVTAGLALCFSNCRSKVRFLLKIHVPAAASATLEFAPRVSVSLVLLEVVLQSPEHWFLRQIPRSSVGLGRGGLTEQDHW